MTEKEYKENRTKCFYLCKDDTLPNELKEEAVADCLFELVKKTSSFVFGWKYLRTMMWHKIIDIRRKEYGCNKNKMEYYCTNEVPEEMGYEDSVLPKLMLEDALNMVFEVKRNVFVDYYIKGLKMEEITEKYMLSESCVFKHLKEVKDEVKFMLRS